MKMIIPDSKLDIVTQCNLLSIPRSTVYYKSRIYNNNDTWLANEMHELWMKYPFYGYRRITASLNRSGYKINHKRVLRIMRLMNLKTIYPKRATISKEQHYKYPYLLSGLTIEKPNHVWSTDLSYLRLSKGFVYVVALIDIYSRYILSWELSISMDTDFCMTMLENALTKNTPQIINSDQGCKFTSKTWTEELTKNNITISMDGKDRWIDNVYIERFWRSLKQEEVYLRPYDNVEEARFSISRYMNFYNNIRPHQSLDYKTPAEVYFANNNCHSSTNTASNTTNVISNNSGLKYAS